MSHLRPVPKPVSSKTKKEATEAVDLSSEKRKKRQAKARGKYAEKRIADLLGGNLTISSGRTALEKGDVRVDYANLFLEVKYCGVRQGRGETSVTFDREWLEKTILDAEAVGMLPVIALRFRDGSGAYATTADVFETLISQYHQLHDENRLLYDLQTLFPEELAALLERRTALLEKLGKLERLNHSS